MRKFTKLIQLTMVLLVSSIIVFGQVYGQTRDSEVKLRKTKKQVGAESFDLTKIVDPNGPNFEVKGELDCPEGSLFGQSCIGYENGVNSEFSLGYRVFQYYSGFSGNITTVTFWGINAVNNGGWWSCSEDPLDVTIEFYGDNNGAPDLDNLLESYAASLDGSGTGVLFAGVFEIMRYTFELPGGVSHLDSWIMIHGAGDPDCWFLWVDSGTPGTL